MMKSKLAFQNSTLRDYNSESLLSRPSRMRYKSGRPTSHVVKPANEKRPTTVHSQRPRTSYILITVSNLSLNSLLGIHEK